MKLFIKCTRNGNPSYSQHEGMSLATIQALLTDLGATNIQQITAEEYSANVPTL